MIFLSNIRLVNFKNFEQIELDFNAKWVCFTGFNGAGKTNLLDSIYYLAIGKSYFNSIDQQLVNTKAGYFNIKGVFNSGEQEVFCAYVPGKPKKIKLNGKDYTRLSDHIGTIPLIMLTPYDHNLISNGSEDRRKFLDLVISQFDPDYLKALVAYNRGLKQRNAHLKYMFENNLHNSELIDVYDEVLCKHGKFIYETRKNFAEELEQIFLQVYGELSPTGEMVGLEYFSNVSSETIDQRLKKSLHADIIANRTQFGIHKDDLTFELNNKPLKKFASQGQQKTYILSLKLAQYQILANKRKQKPLLLLDDIFDRLDLNRITNLLKLISNENFGQIFLSDTSADRVRSLLHKNGINGQIINVHEGKIKE